jgi:hypothetical protein
LGSQALTKVRERFELAISVHRSIQEGREVVNPLEGPTCPYKVAFEIALDAFLQELHGAVANSARAADSVGGLKPFPAEQEPVVWIGLVCPHARRKPERTTSA